MNVAHSSKQDDQAEGGYHVKSHRQEPEGEDGADLGSASEQKDRRAAQAIVTGHDKVKFLRSCLGHLLKLRWRSEQPAARGDEHAAREEVHAEHAAQRVVDRGARRHAATR
eukprot:scaffold128528_cov69-Phaeocystis_antarctica.AAC.2